MAEWDQSLKDVSDTQLRAALDHAHIPALLASLLNLSGDIECGSDIRPLVVPFAEDADGLAEPQREAARKLAFKVLQDYRARGCPELTPPQEVDITTMMDRITGEPIEPAMREFMREELNLYGEDARRVEIDTSNLSEDYRVLIIGTGMSGILAAIRLQQQGIPFLMVEKNPEVTGTWYENTYPGCQVDSANHVYNYMFEQNHQWPGHYSGSAELFAYFERMVDKYALREHIWVNCPVIRASFDNDGKRWHVQLERDGVAETLVVNTVISAVGQLNQPKFPDIEGLDTFAGVSFHSARWEHQHQLAGKKVIVIGTGCSAVQFVPEIAPQCGQLTVFQRNAPWLVPTEDYHVPMTAEELWLFREIPFYARWYRFFLFRVNAADGLLPYSYADEGWQGPAGTIGADNEILREALTMSLAEQTGDDAEFLAKLVPSYPPLGKRPVLDDGSWIQALQRDNVSLVTDGIARVVPEGVVTADGTLHEADVLIYGTGFQAEQFLVPMEVVGRTGVELVSYWGGDPHAHKGLEVSGYPNFYCLYGPNSNIVVGSSIVFMVECQMRYVIGCLKLQIENGHATMECRPEVMESFNARVDALNKQRAWGTPLVDSWYKNDQGRVTQNWPGTHFEWWQETLKPNPADYLLD